MAKGNSSTSNAQSVGTIKGLIGTATATDANGVVRTLHVGDKVYANEIIQTSAAGTVQIEFANANFATVGHGSSLALDKAVFDPNAKPGHESDDSIAKAQAKIASGADPTEVTDASAAGPTAGGDDGQGAHSAVFVQQNAASGNLSPTAEFETSSVIKAAAAASGDGFIRVNTPPVAEPATNEVAEDGELVSGNVVATDFDGDTLTYSLVGEAPVGLIFNSDGSYTFDPTSALAHATYDSMAAGETKTMTVEYSVSDGNGGTDTSTLTITITGTNDLPIITSVEQTGAVSEGDDGSPMTTSGQITFTDVDLSDIHTFSVSTNATYGTASVDENGNWIYTVNDSGAVDKLPEGVPLTDTFTVQVSDGQGGFASQSVTITITGTNDVAVITGTSTGTVTEAGSGLNFGDPFASGKLLVSDVDTGEAHFHMPAFADLVGDYGVFLFNPLTGGWVYTLNNLSPATQALTAGEHAQDTLTVTSHDGTEQIITVDITGTNDNARIVVLGTQDTKVAEAGGDHNGTDTNPSASGILKVLDVDAGENHFGTATGDYAGSNGYGSFHFDASTGAWTYALDNNNAATEALLQGQKVYDRLTVTSQDGTDDYTISVTITGSNDMPIIVLDTGNLANANDAVNESGMASGTLASDGTEFAHGTFTVSDVDGLGNIKSITIAGETFTVGSGGLSGLVGSEADTAHGTVTLTAYNNGTFSYTYELTHATTDVDNAIETDSFGVTVTDNSNASANVTVTIDINDDAPVLHVTQGVDQGIVPVTLTGELAHMGADVGPDVPGNHISWDSLPSGLTSNGIAVTYTGLGTDTVTGMAGDKAVFTLTGNANGTYEFEQFSQLSNSQLTSTASHSFSQDLANAKAYYMYADGSLYSTDGAANWTVKITATESTWLGNVAADVNPTSNGLGVDREGLLNSGSNEFNGSRETMTLEFNEGANETSAVTIAVNGLEHHNIVIPGFIDYDETLSWTAYYTDGTHSSGSVVESSLNSGTFTIMAKDGTYLDHVVLSTDSLTSVTINSITTYTQADFTFGFTATDGDGDHVSGNLTIEGSLIATNDAPTLTVSGNIDVAESGLVGGSNALADTEHASGTFSVHDDQGLHDISTITLGGTILAVGSDGLVGLIGTTVNTAHGTVEITGYNANANGTDGTFTYEYTLTGASNATKDSFGVAISDGASSSSANITVNIADDAPVAIHDAMSQTEASSVTYSGVNNLIYNDIFGADGTGTPSLFSAAMAVKAIPLPLHLIRTPSTSAQPAQLPSMGMATTPTTLPTWPTMYLSISAM